MQTLNWLALLASAWMIFMGTVMTITGSYKLLSALIFKFVPQAIGIALAIAAMVPMIR